MQRAQMRQETDARPTGTAAGQDGQRQVTTYRVGKLVTAAGPMLCIVRTLSERAATLDIDMPFVPQDGAALEIGRERLVGALVRLGDRKAQIRSEQAIDIDSIISDSSLVAAAGRRTLPRVAIDSRCRIDIGLHRAPAQVCDISTDGIKLHTEELLGIGDEVRIVLRGLENPLPGIVRWVSGDYAGVEFHQRLPIGRLNLWLASAAAEGGWEQGQIVSKS